jgi:hypothetical protein
LLKFSENYKIKKEKTAERLKQWRENQYVVENVTHSEHVRNASKVKISKVNRSKVKKEVFIPPVLNDVLVYFDENGYSKEAATKAFNYYTNLNWKNSKGNQVINWKNTMQNWFTPENEKKKYHLYPKLMN